MTPTPRTDACTFHLALCNNDLPTDAVVPAEKMKELERENAELRKAIEGLIRQFCTKSAELTFGGRYPATMNSTQIAAYHAARSALEPAQPPAQKQ